MEYTQLAEYGGDILVEHDVTFDLFDQIARRDRTSAAWWDCYRWRRFENRAIRALPQRGGDVEEGCGAAWPAVPPARCWKMASTWLAFVPQPEHRANGCSSLALSATFRISRRTVFLRDKVWPLLSDKFPEMTLTVVCGPDHLTYWRAFTDSPEPRPTRASAC